MTALTGSERFPMRVVARMTGLAPDTIRAWERRYAAVVPERSEGNTRRYSADDVRRLTLLKELVDRGHAISGVASLAEEELQRLAVGTLTVSQGGDEANDGDEMPGMSFSAIREAYLGAVSRLDTRRASEILLRVATLLDARDTVFRLVVPLMQEVGERWAHAELGVAQEHLVSAQLRGLVSNLLRLSPPDRGARRLLLTTPSGHRHEFGILAAALLAAGRGFDVVYLGPDLPNEELEWSVRLARADVLVLGVVKDMGARECEELSTVLEGIHGTTRIWLGLPEGHALARATPFARHFHDFEALDMALANWGA